MDVQVFHSLFASRLPRRDGRIAGGSPIAAPSAPPPRVMSLMAAWSEATASHAAVARRPPSRIAILTSANPAAELHRKDPRRHLTGRVGTCADVALRADDTPELSAAVAAIAQRARAVGAPEAAAHAVALEAEVDDWARHLKPPRQDTAVFVDLAWLSVARSSYSQIPWVVVEPFPFAPPSAYAQASFLDSIVRRRERDRLFDLLCRAFAIEDDEDQFPPERPEQRVPIPDAPERSLPRETRAGPALEPSASADDGGRAAGLGEVAA